MIRLQWYNGEEWVYVAGEWATEQIAWITLGDDYLGYRTVDENGNVLSITNPMV